MNYLVRPLANVTLALARAERSVQDDFQQIASILALNLFPNPQFPLITEDVAVDGSRLYTYPDDYFPYAIQYVVFEPERHNYGVVAILDLVRLPGLGSDASRLHKGLVLELSAEMIVNPGAGWRDA